MGAGQQTIHIRDQLRHTSTHPPKLTRQKPPHHNGGKKADPFTTADGGVKQIVDRSRAPTHEAARPQQN